MVLLPEYVEVSGLQSVSLESTSEDVEESSGRSEDRDIYSTIISGSFVPSATQRMTEQADSLCSKRQSRHQAVAPPTVSWPPSGSTSLQLKVTSHVPFLQFLSGAADFVALTSWCARMVDFQDTLVFIALLSTLRYCSTNNISAFISIHIMLSSERQTVSCTTPAVYTEQGSTGSDSEVVSLPWWTHSSLIVQSPELVRLICPDDPDFSSARNKAIHENSAVLGAPTTRSTSSGSTLMFTAWPGFQMHLVLTN